MASKNSSSSLTDKLLSSPAQPIIDALDWINPLLIALHTLVLVSTTNLSMLSSQVLVSIALPSIWLGVFILTRTTGKNQPTLPLANLYTVAQIILLSLYIWQVSGLSHLAAAALVGVMVISFMRASLPIVIASLLVIELIIALDFNGLLAYLRQSDHLALFVLIVMFTYLTTLMLKALQVGRQLARANLVSALESSANIERYDLIEQLNDLPVAAMTATSQGAIIYVNQLASKLFDKTNHRISDLAELELHNADGPRVNLATYLISDSLTLPKLTTGLNPKTKPFTVSIKKATRDNQYLVYFLPADESSQLNLQLAQTEAVLENIKRQSYLLNQKTTNLLKLTEAGATAAVVKKENQQLDQQATKLQASLDNLQYFVSAKANLSTRETINLRDYANQLYQRYIDLAERQNLELDLDLGARLSKIDLPISIVDNILDILIRNAIQHTNSGSVAIQISQLDGQTIFSIKDSGNGIAKTSQESIQKMIDAFASRRTLVDKKSSLSIAGFLARSIQAELTFNSRLYHGSTFSLVIPD